MKKMIVLLLALLLTMTAAMAEELYAVEQMEPGECGITCYYGTDAEVVIPAEIDGVPVTYLRETFFCNPYVTRVVIPEGVVELGYDVFLECENLRSVQLPSTLKRIGGKAFAGCTSLTEINLHDGIEMIEDDSFYGSCKLLNNEEFVSVMEKIGGTLPEAQNDPIELSGWIGGSVDQFAAEMGLTEADGVVIHARDGATISAVELVGVSDYMLLDCKVDMIIDEIFRELGSRGFEENASDRDGCVFVNAGTGEKFSVRWDECAIPLSLCLGETD